MNFNNLPSEIHSLIFQANRDAVVAEAKKYDDFYDGLDEDDQDELHEAVNDLYYRVGDYADDETDSADEDFEYDGEEPEPYPDLDYIEESGEGIAFYDLKVKDKKWFYEKYMKAYWWNYDIMISGNPY